METIYKSSTEDTLIINYEDLKLYYEKEENTYGLFIEELIGFSTVNDLKDYYIKLIEDCKKYLEKNENVIDRTKYLYFSSIDMAIDYSEDTELYEIGFNTPEFKTVNDVYEWLCKASRLLHSLN